MVWLFPWPQNPCASLFQVTLVLGHPLVQAVSNYSLLNSDDVLKSHVVDSAIGDPLLSNIYIKLVALGYHPSLSVVRCKLQVFASALDYSTRHSSAARRKVHRIRKWASKLNRHLITVKKDVASIQTTMTNLESRMIKVEEEMTAIKVRFDTMDIRMNDMEKRLNSIEKIMENMEKTMDSMEKKMDDMEKKMDDIGQNIQLSLTAALILKPVPLATPLLATEFESREDLAMVNPGA